MLVTAVVGALAVLGACASSASASAYPVTTTADAGPGSLRQAIIGANAHAGADQVRFALPGSGVRTIALTSKALPPVTDHLTIDGRTQAGFTNTPLVRIDNATGSTRAVGLDIRAAQSQVLSLEITRFAQGIRLAADGTIVTGSLVGTDAAGAAGLGNTVGIAVASGAGNRIGGTGPTGANVISGNPGAGVEILGSATTQTRVLGNRIGTNPAGTAARPNSNGVRVTGGATPTTVGGTSAAARNVISGNTQHGLFIQSTGTTILGNYIGTDATGTAPLGNNVGVELGSGSNTLGGTDPGAGNVISGNYVGADLGSGNVVLGNRIGTDASGTTALGNGSYGIQLSGASNTTIGGTTAAARNVISGNGGGIDLIRSSNNTIAGNYIGTDVSGAAPLGNTGSGVYITAAWFGSQSSGNIVGGTASGARNVISANGSGVDLFADREPDGAAIVRQNVVAGNYIGTGASGTTALGNHIGVSIGAVYEGLAEDNTIGGSTGAARNVISGNTFAGVDFETQADSQFTGNLVRGNYIGTDKYGEGALPNRIGVYFWQINEEGAYQASGNIVGGPAAGDRNVISGNTDAAVDVENSNATGDAYSIEGNFIGTKANGVDALGNGAGVLFPGQTLASRVAGNRIAFNAAPGVQVHGPYANGVSIVGNSMFSNSGLGIDLAGGGNHNQAAPVIDTVSTSGATTTIGGTLASTPSTTFRIELFSSPACDPSGAGEGKTFLGSVDTTTDGSGNGTFSTGVAAVLPGRAITATATSQATGDTSEFSLCHASP